MKQSHETQPLTISRGQIELLRGKAGMQYLELVQSGSESYIDVMQGRLHIDTVHYSDLNGWLSGYSALFQKRGQ